MFFILFCLISSCQCYILGFIYILLWLFSLNLVLHASKNIKLKDSFDTYTIKVVDRLLLKN